MGALKQLTINPTKREQKLIDKLTGRPAHSTLSTAGGTRIHHATSKPSVKVLYTIPGQRNEPQTALAQ